MCLLGMNRGRSLSDVFTGDRGFRLGPVIVS